MISEKLKLGHSQLYKRVVKSIFCLGTILPTGVRCSPHAVGPFLTNLGSAHSKLSLSVNGSRYCVPLSNVSSFILNTNQILSKTPNFPHRETTILTNKLLLDVLGRVKIGLLLELIEGVQISIGAQILGDGFVQLLALAAGKNHPARGDRGRVGEGKPLRARRKERKVTLFKQRKALKLQSLTELQLKRDSRRYTTKKN